MNRKWLAVAACTAALALPAPAWAQGPSADTVKPFNGTSLAGWRTEGSAQAREVEPAGRSRGLSPSAARATASLRPTLRRSTRAGRQQRELRPLLASYALRRNQFQRQSGLRK